MRATAPRRIPAHELAPGQVVRLGGQPVGRVREVTEPRHGVAAAHGAVSVTLERERTLAADRDRFGTVITWQVTVLPDARVWIEPDYLAGQLPPHDTAGGDAGT